MSDWTDLFALLAAEDNGADYQAIDDAWSEVRRSLYLFAAVADLESFGLRAEEDLDALVDEVLLHIQTPAVVTSLRDTSSPFVAVMRIIRERADALGRQRGRIALPDDDAGDRGNRMDYLLESLTDQEVQVFLLHFGEGRTAPDIAAQLELPISRVLQQLIRVTSRVRELFSHRN